jgi:hypothetical protein
MSSRSYSPLSAVPQPAGGRRCSTACSTLSGQSRTDLAAVATEPEPSRRSVERALRSGFASAVPQHAGGGRGSTTRGPLSNVGCSERAPARLHAETEQPAARARLALRLRLRRAAARGRRGTGCSRTRCRTRLALRLRRSGRAGRGRSAPMLSRRGSSAARMRRTHRSAAVCRRELNGGGFKEQQCVQCVAQHWRIGKW